MRALVTGGAGFIGSHIVRELLARGHEVRVIDNLSTGKRSNLDDVEGAIELFEGDMRDPDLVRSAMTGVDYIFHEAALPSVPRSIEDPISSVSVNMVGMATILKAAVDAGVRRVVYAGSSSAYGNSPESIKRETIPPQPLSPYAVTKLAGEYLLQAFTHCYAIETVGLRYFNVFGERQDPTSQYSGVIAKFSRMMLRGERPTINGDGTISRDFTYVQNVVDGNMLAAFAPHVNGQVFNIACGDSISLVQLVEELNKALGTSLAPIFGPPRKGDVQYSRADITKAQELLGYNPRVDFASGLNRTLDWYASNLDALEAIG